MAYQAPEDIFESLYEPDDHGFNDTRFAPLLAPAIEEGDRPSDSPFGLRPDSAGPTGLGPHDGMLGGRSRGKAALLGVSDLDMPPRYSNLSADPPVYPWEEAWEAENPSRGLRVQGRGPELEPALDDWPGRSLPGFEQEIQRPVHPLEQEMQRPVHPLEREVERERRASLEMGYAAGQYVSYPPGTDDDPYGIQDERSSRLSNMMGRMGLGRRERQPYVDHGYGYDAAGRMLGAGDRQYDEPLDHHARRRRSFESPFFGRGRRNEGVWGEDEAGQLTYTPPRRRRSLFDLGPQRPILY